MKENVDCLWKVNLGEEASEAEKRMIGNVLPPLWASVVRGNGMVVRFPSANPFKSQPGGLCILVDRERRRRWVGNGPLGAPVVPLAPLPEVLDGGDVPGERRGVPVLGARP